MSHAARRALAIFLAVVLLEVIVVLVVAAWALVAARGELDEARRHAVAGQASVRDIDLEHAQTSLTAAATHFDRGAAALRNPAVRIVATAPVIRENVRTVEALAVSGGIVADTGADLLTTINQQPDGLSSFLPSDGRFPVNRLALLARRAGTAKRRLADAAATMDAVPGERLVGPVNTARRQFEDELTRSRELVGSAAAASGAFADLLGGDGPRRYLFGAQNPAELRGTGGYIGAYAVATFDRGRFRLSDFVPIQQLRSVPLSDVPPPSSDYAARYNRYGGAGFWPAVNATPDFPSAAESMVRLYGRTEGVDLDGVVVVDPYALQALLDIVGDVRVPGIGSVTADDVVDVVSNEAYAEFSTPQDRKEVLGAVAGSALHRLLDPRRAMDPQELFDTLVPVGRDRHLLLYSRRPAVQDALRSLDLAGALIEPTSDTVSVVVNNAAVNKVDFYVDRSVDYRVRLRPDGSATATLRVTFHNRAPARGPGDYVLGPRVAGLRAGDDRSLVSVFCGRCVPTGGDPPLGTNERKAMVLEQELGHTVASTLMTVPRRSRRSLTLSWSLTDAWSVDNGCYTLSYLAQPTIRDTDLRVSVQAPPDHRRTTDPDAGDLLFEGSARGLATMHACYSASDDA